MNRLDAGSIGIYLNFSLQLRGEFFIDGDDPIAIHYIHFSKVYGTRNAITDVLESFQDHVKNNTEIKLSQLEGSEYVLEEIKFLEINILRQAVPQAVGSYV